MMNAIALNDNEPDLVVGGDYGDAAKDNGAEPRYKVGDVVEQYFTPFHWNTHRRQITGVYKAEKCWVYTFGENGTGYHHTADDFQSN